MNAQRGKRYAEEYKQELLERFRQSGLSVSRFCQNEGLSYGTLKRWLGPEPAKQTRFVEVGEAASKEARLSVAMPNGLWIELPLDAERTVAANWIRELKAC